MLGSNKPRQPLHSWKEIAAYLEKSERTVRRWEATEGLPVHRRKHRQQDSVFAYRHELDRWDRQRTRLSDGASADPATPFPAETSPAPVSAYLTEHDAITRTMHGYIAGAKAGDSRLMRPSFHPKATISGYCLGVEYDGSIEHVFDWVDRNGPAPRLEPRFARIEIIATIALIHLEVRGWSGKLAGADARASDVFTLLKREGEWKITHKLFHWHDT